MSASSASFFSGGTVRRQILAILESWPSEFRQLEYPNTLGDHYMFSLHKHQLRPHHAAVFELMSFADDATPEQLEVKTRYEAALGAFYRRDFETARAGFEALQKEKSDKSSEFMLLHPDYFHENPPREDWEGDIPLMTK